MRRSTLLASLIALLSLAPASIASHKGDGVNDLSITQADAPDPVTEGGFVAYTLAVSNRGPHPAQEVTVDHRISAGKTVAASGQRWECVILPVVNRTSCAHHGSLPSRGSAAPLRIVVEAPSAESPAITSTAEVGSHGTEMNPDDNHSEEITIVEEGDDLDVSQFDEPHEVTSTQLVRYVVSVENHGTTTATGVNLSHAISAGTVEGAAGEGWSCSGAGSSAACTLNDPLPPETAAPDISVVVRAPETTEDSSITATATVSSDRTDSNAGDNTAVETTIVHGLGQNRATAYIPPQGGSITTNPTGKVTTPPGGADSVAFASATEETPGFASPTDPTIGDAIYPAGPGGVASLFEGSDQLAICAVPLVNCAGAALDVIVPQGYNDPQNPIEVNLIYDHSVAPVSEGNRTVYVEKPVNGVPTTLVLPDCSLLEIANPSPCVDFQVRLDDGDLLIRILMLSQDPKYQG